MGLFSFLFGGKKKPKATKSAKPAVIEEAATVASIASALVAPAAGAIQAKLRLKLAAALRSGETAAAYEAAKGLADIQLRAGRKNVARVWQQQADRLKASLPA